MSKHGGTYSYKNYVETIPRSSFVDTARVTPQKKTSREKKEREAGGWGKRSLIHWCRCEEEGMHGSSSPGPEMDVEERRKESVWACTTGST